MDIGARRVEFMTHDRGVLMASQHTRKINGKLFLFTRTVGRHAVAISVLDMSTPYQSLETGRRHMIVRERD